MSAAMTISGTIGWFVLTSGRPIADVVFWRCAFAVVALLSVCHVLGHLRRGLSKREGLLAVGGGLAIVLNWLLLFAAFPRSTISIATAVYNVQPFILLGLGAAFLREKLTAAKLGWLALSLTGLVLIVQVGMSDIDLRYLGGVGMALTAAFFWAISTIFTKRLSGVPPQLIALVHVSIGAIMLAPFASWASPPTGATAWACLATIGFVHTGLVYIMMYEAVQRLPTHVQGALSFLYPAVAILVDVLALHHRLSVLQSMGIAAILVAAAGMSGILRVKATKAAVPSGDVG